MEGTSRTVIERSPGEQPVELALRLRSGSTQLLRLNGVSDIDALVPEIQPLLGVLGTARRIGAAERQLATAAAG